MANNLLKLAKKNGGDNKSTTAKKSTEIMDEKPISPTEERDMKAKQKVRELLKDVNLKPETKEEIFELEQEKSEKPDEKSIEWLQEQVSLLSEECERLKTELKIVNENYAKIFTEYQKLKNSSTIVGNDANIKMNLIRIFNELQSNHLSLGNNFIIYPVAFMNRLIMFFPFLNEHKRF